MKRFLILLDFKVRCFQMSRIHRVSLLFGIMEVQAKATMMTATMLSYTTMTLIFTAQTLS